MANMKIEVRLLGTCCFATSKDGKATKINNKKYINIREKIKGDGTSFYTFSGPNIFDLGITSMKSNIKNATTLISDKIDNWAHENKDSKDSFQVTIWGHSRGGVAATRLVDNLKDMYKKDKRVSIKLRVSDPYAGPTYTTGKNVSIDLNQNQDTKNENYINDDSMVFYSMGTLFPCSPQKIKNAKTVVICRAGHIKSEDDMFSAVENKYDVLKQGGVYVLKSKDEIFKVTKENLVEAMDVIYNWRNSYSARTRVLTQVIVSKLNLKVDDIIATGAVREWEPAFKKCLENIRKSKTLWGAFNYVLDLFSDKLFGMYINKTGRFFRCIEAAKSAVAGVGNNDYKTALYKLDIIIGKSHHRYKVKLASALKERIMRYYEQE